LERFGVKATPAIPALIELLRKSKCHYREEGSNVWDVMHALRQIGPEATKALLDAMDDDPVLLKNGVMDALVDLRAVPEIIGCLQSGTAPVRKAAAQALAHVVVAPWDASYRIDFAMLRAVRTALRAVVEGQDGDVREMAAEALTQLKQWLPDD
jgi:HEAT repeat protein